MNILQVSVFKTLLVDDGFQKKFVKVRYLVEFTPYNLFSVLLDKLYLYSRNLVGYFLQSTIIVV